MSQSGEQAHAGSRSLKVDITAPFGWGVTMRNYQGVPAGPGPQTISFWGRAGAGTGLSATLTVHWRDAAGSELRADSVEVPVLDDTWRQATADVVAPPGTARVGADLTSASGGTGELVFLDDVVIADDTSSVPPALDYDTATLEGSTGQWLPWFSTAISSSAEQAHAGARSLKVDINGRYGWGVTQGNYPSFAATPGGLWAMAGSASAGAGLWVTMDVSWRTADGTVLQVDQLTVPAGATWTEAVATVTAPPGTARVRVDLRSATGGPGDVVHIDDVTVTAFR